MATLKTVASYAVEEPTVFSGNQRMDPGPSPTLSSPGDLVMCHGAPLQVFISWEEQHHHQHQNF